MKTRYMQEYDVKNRGRLVTLFIADVDVANATFNFMDNILLKECDKSDRVADKISGLELIVRRIEEIEK